jgi:hypothetical protein
LPFNEQNYSDVVQILDHYEDTISHFFEEAASPVQKVHVGGDLLTRERITGAKGLRSGYSSILLCTQLVSLGSSGTFTVGRSVISSIPKKSQSASTIN